MAKQDARGEFSSLGFARTFVFPALLLFVVPGIALAFFYHAQTKYDAEARTTILQQIREDRTLSPAEKAEQIAVFESIPFSKLLEIPEFAAQVDSDVTFRFAQFRWMIWISLGCIVAGVIVFAVAAVCVLASLQSHRVQYYSLAVGWHVLRIFGALQTVAQGALLVALSFWVTALWFEVYIPKLIFVVGALAVVGVFVVLKGIFTTPRSDFSIEGQLVSKETARPLWDDLDAVCAKVGTELPDQIVAGIDDNFFVTEQPVTVDGKVLRGRTLYVSLSLLKQLNGSEAAAVMAHEMAHFSGQDTTYSKKISPLLIRYGNYLQALESNLMTAPIFYFMLCFRGLYELSLGRLSRQREFRADRIAAETTSPRDFAGAMLRISAYSRYRGEVEHELFKQEEALAEANILHRIEHGFGAFAHQFVAKEDIGELETSHPFDSHPPLVDRLAAIGAPLDIEASQALLANPGDGRWYAHIGDATEMERGQWAEYEERFRKFHEEILAYRFLPANPAEEAAVIKYFPEVRFESKKGTLVIDFARMSYTQWAEPVTFATSPTWP